MSKPILRIEFPTTAPAGALFKHSNPTINVPCAIAIESLTEDQVISLVKQTQATLNGKLFRDIDLFMETYRDYKKAVECTYNWIYHAYLRLTLRPDGVLRISADNRPFGDESGGGTIYSLDQFQSMLNHAE